MSSRTSPMLQPLLLDLISPIPVVDQTLLDGLTHEDWTELLGMAQFHRLGPLLRWQLSRVHTELSIPSWVQNELNDSHKNTALRSLLLQRELVQIHRVLEQAGIPHIALKGAFLAFHTYPNPALRPMRDLDILIPKDKALDAFRLLLDNGLSRMDRFPGSPETHLELAKHMPQLLSPTGKVVVELHVRLSGAKGSGAHADLSDAPGLWQRCKATGFAGDNILCESPTDLLLDMIIHAVYQHQFDNGPLLLSDLAFLLGSQPIDWDLFWELAAYGGHTRGCILALKLTEHYWGEQPITWPQGREPDATGLSAQIGAMALLMFRDSRRKTDFNLGKAVANTPSLTGKAHVIFRRLFPPTSEIALRFPVSEQSLKVYLWYPAYWRKAIERLPAFLHSRHQEHMRQTEQELKSLETWLNLPSQEA